MKCRFKLIFKIFTKQGPDCANINVCRINLNIVFFVIIKITNHACAFHDYIILFVSYICK